MKSAWEEWCNLRLEYDFLKSRGLEPQTLAVNSKGMELLKEAIDKLSFGANPGSTPIRFMNSWVKLDAEQKDTFRFKCA